MNLKVDDEYCYSVANYYRTSGENLNKNIKEYINILREIKKYAIKKGEVADALDAYISYASKLNSKFLQISKNAQKYAKRYVEKIDDADKYLF